MDVRAHDMTHLTQYSLQRKNVQTPMQKGVQDYVHTTPPVLNHVTKVISRT